ncbi:hypothetical protein ACQJBY_042997 [Aegilops geniculata]
MRLSLVNSWVGRPSSAVTGVAGNRRRGEPLPLPGARSSGRLKTPGQAGPSQRDPTWQRLGVDPALGPRLKCIQPKGAFSFSSRGLFVEKKFTDRSLGFNPSYLDNRDSD